MMETKLSSKGQVVLPKAVRDALNWPAGADLTVEQGDDFVVLRRKASYPPTTIDDVSGMFKVDRPITDEMIEAAIEAEARRRWRRKG
jgi:AbrB family looped-hinge helix DNA binding protein